MTTVQKLWGDKPYYSLSYYFKQTFGEKVYKISLNGGMTCPNRDGTVGDRGCIFCSEGGSGDFSANPCLSIREQIEEGKKLVSKKFAGSKYIAYFQAYTNTYAPVAYLEEIYSQALQHPDIIALSIATRPDCINTEVINLLKKLKKEKPIWIELGLQTIHEKSASFIRRGYPLSRFEKAVSLLKESGLPVIVHTIIGLPGEEKTHILETMDYLSACHVDGIKLQLLHILKKTDLALYYEKEHFHVLTLEEYCDIVISCLEHLPQDMVIHRITGDAPKDLLIAPLWSLDKKKVLNTIHRKMSAYNTWQGKYL